MKAAITNRDPDAHFCLMAFLAAVVALPVARSQETTQTREAIPLIQMDNVPLKDAIRNLAGQTGQNFLLDPRLDGPWAGPDGRSGREPTVTMRWENLTAEQALGRLLKEHGLAMVANPATSIARIAFTNQAVKPVPVSAVGGGTNAVIPLVVMASASMAPNPNAKRLAPAAHSERSAARPLLSASRGPWLWQNNNR